MSNDLVIWASQDVTLPVAGTANKIKPDPQLSDLGWDKGQKPSAQEFNFILNQVTSTINRINKYGAPLIGELIFWPLQQMPQEIWPDCGIVCIPYIAQAFDPVKYPLLKILHPSGFLPADMRGEFPRGWDNGRMVDSDRVLMSAQGDAIRNVTGKASAGDRSSFSSTQNEPTEGAFILEGNSGNMTSGAAISTSYPCLRTLRFDASRVVPTAKENRPRNIAWNMIVRAA